MCPQPRVLKVGIRSYVSYSLTAPLSKETGVYLISRSVFSYKELYLWNSVVQASPSSFQPPLLLCFSSLLLASSPSEERLRGELGLWLLKREAGGGPRVLREHCLSLQDLICESAGCFLHPRVVWPMPRCDYLCPRSCSFLFLFACVWFLQMKRFELFA